jgi:hypothetical protein
LGPCFLLISIYLRGRAMLALAFLAVTRATLADEDATLASSANEIRRMFTALCAQPRDDQHAPPLVTLAPPPPGTRPPLSLPSGNDYIGTAHEIRFPVPCRNCMPRMTPRLTGKAVRCE